MDNIIVLYIRPYDLVDEDTGERKQGVSVHYIDKTMVTNDKENGVGYPVLKNSIDIGKMSSIVKVPGVYEPVFRTYVTKGVRATKLDDLRFISDVALFVE